MTINSSCVNWICAREEERENLPITKKWQNMFGFMFYFMHFILHLRIECIFVWMWMKCNDNSLFALYWKLQFCAFFSIIICLCIKNHLSTFLYFWIFFSLALIFSSFFWWFAARMRGNIFSEKRIGMPCRKLGDCSVITRSVFLGNDSSVLHIWLFVSFCKMDKPKTFSWN